ncbi:hypothetical protein BDP27DRAFT_1336821, partial [Rhodocollybia butyracea]
FLSTTFIFLLIWIKSFQYCSFHRLSIISDNPVIKLFTQLCFKINHHITLSFSIIHESLVSGSALLSCYVNYFRLSYAALTWIYANMAPAPN